MKKHFIPAILISIVALALASCSSKVQPIAQFTDLTDANVKSKGIKQFEAKPFLPELKPDDELFITVNSQDPEATALFNSPSVNPATRAEMSANTVSKQKTYVVDSQGFINLPRIGRLHVAGKNVEQVASQIEDIVKKEVIDPLVTVSLANFTVTVGGEVKEPKTLKVDRARLSVLDALSQCGDISEYGRRDNVLLIRENIDGTQNSIILDLTSSDIFDSPYFYLQPNDYIYVTPNKVLQDNSKYNQNNAFKLSVISTIVSAASVIASLVIALTVK